MAGKIDRRRLIQQAGVVAGASAGAAWAALAPHERPFGLHDPTGAAGAPKFPARKLPSFAVSPSNVLPELGVARGEAPARMLRAAVDAVGGIARFVRSGDTVLIKPNVAFERSAPLGATTHPEILTALVALVREAGAKEVRVADNPIESPESCFLRSGIRKAAADAGARIYLPTESDFETIEVPGATWIERWPFFYRPFIGVDKVIGIAPVKDHNLCRASMSTKNWYGLLGGRRNQFHQDIHGIISDLALMMRPTLVIVDGTRVLHQNGPTGGSLRDVRPGHAVLASQDSVAADAFAWAHLLQRKDEALPDYFAQCVARGLGQSELSALRIKEVHAG